MRSPGCTGSLQMDSTGNTAMIWFWHFPQLVICQCVLVCAHPHTVLLTRVNLEHISSASLIMPAFSMYLAHFELMNLSAVSRAWASSIHWAASLMFPACCRGIKVNAKVTAGAPATLRSSQAQIWGACYLVNLGFDEEELDECRRTLDGCVDVF